MSDDNFLARWSRRKIEARRDDGELGPGLRRGESGAPQPVTPAPPVTPAQPITPAQPVTPAQAGAQSPEPLPPLESLTPHSDFAPFMREGVDPATKGQALRTLFSDPALYPMDGLDVYIDDYSKPDPLPEGWLEKLNQFAALDSHNQPERDAEARRLAAIPASTPPTESAAPSPASVPEPPPSGSPSDTSAPPPAPPDAMDRGAP